MANTEGGISWSDAYTETTGWILNIVEKLKRIKQFLQNC